MAVGFRALRARLTRNPKIRKGQSLVEFTIMLPVLLIMLSGLVEAGIALNVYLDLIDTTREGGSLTLPGPSSHPINASTSVKSCGLTRFRSISVR